MPPLIRNVAVIAHVDHGKTTLVTKLLVATGTFRANQQVAEQALDTNDLERERGITILAKNCAAEWKGVKVNILDTPGHADFGGEVERVLGMADGALLVVDAADGPMPQTRFVLRKAFEAGLAPVVVINKVDRGGARPHQVLDEVFDLFIDLEATDAQLDFPVVYANAKAGLAGLDPDTPMVDITPVLDVILERVPPPAADPADPLRMRIASIDYNDYVGRIGIGKVVGGAVRGGMEAVRVRRDGTRERFQVKTLYGFRGMSRVEVERVEAGDICAVVGMEEVDIGDSICDPEDVRPLPTIEVEPPTITMRFEATTSPLRGQEGHYVTSRQLRERLYREVKSNVALRVEDTDRPDAFDVSGRGLLHLGILVENMRREGYEFQVGRPRVITRDAAEGAVLEPYEDVVVDVPEDHSGKVIEMMGTRRGEMRTMRQTGTTLRMEFLAPSRALMGLRTRLLNMTRGEAVMTRVYHGYGPWAGELPARTAGVLVSMLGGSAVAYGLNLLQDRGALFVRPGDLVYEGMVVGEHCRDNDLVVNPCREKHLTNVRAAGKDDNIHLVPPRVYDVEGALEYIGDDELVEVTPRSLRLRKRLLNEKDRKRARPRE
ncbi:MAG: translational GTPase TypA [Planctomycetes bacterium]|nr:translational GTPase TypA [Planctomycetota bacterium]